jgi:hypothetical protein
VIVKGEAQVVREFAPTIELDGDAMEVIARRRPASLGAWGKPTLETRILSVACLDGTA